MNVFGLNEQLTSDEAKRLRKNDLKNLLTSYADEADVFAEILQNAFDAIGSAIRQDYYTQGTNPEILIFIGRRSNDTHYFSVFDNGIGMSPEVVSKFTIPGFSHLKKMGKTIGYKGVGASFFFASSEKISISTKDLNNNRSSLTVKGSYSWIMNETEPEPLITEVEEFPNAVRENIRDCNGTTVCYYFHPGIKPKSLNNIVIQSDILSDELINWSNFLCAKTCLGIIKDISSLNISIRLFLDNGTEVISSQYRFGDYNRENKLLGYPFPWKVFAVHTELSSIDSTPPALSYRHKNKYQAIHTKWNRDEIEAMGIDFSEEEIELVSNHLDLVDVYFSYSTDVMKEVHRRMGTRSMHLRYGIRIVVDGVPQGRMMDFDLTSSQGLNRQTHAVVAFRGLELDTGRKIPSNEVIAEVIRKIGVRIMNKLSEYRWCLKKKDRPPVSENLDNWRNLVESKTSNSITLSLFNCLNIQPPICIDPESENDVIALFVACISSNLLKGYRLQSLSGYNRYDGLIDIDKLTASVCDINDIFSVRDTSVPNGGRLKVIEFKHTFSDLIEDFEQQKKNPTEIDLAVCWSLPGINPSRGELTYCYFDRKDTRPYYAVTHIWSDENQTSIIPIICLQYFIAEYLKDRETSPGLGLSAFTVLNTKDKEGII